MKGYVARKGDRWYPSWVLYEALLRGASIQDLVPDMLPCEFAKDDRSLFQLL